MGFPGITMVKNLPQYSRHRRHGFDHCVGTIPWSNPWQPMPVFLPGKFHGQRSQAGYSPWGHKELDRTEWLSTHMHRNRYVCTFFAMWLQSYNWVGWSLFLTPLMLCLATLMQSSSLTAPWQMTNKIMGYFGKIVQEMIKPGSQSTMES